jgi:hypothetical protein
VEDGTPVKVLEMKKYDLDPQQVEVRVLDGKLVGKAVFTNRYHLYRRREFQVKEPAK